MKPSSKNEAMNGLVKAYIAQKKADKADGTHHADTWKRLNGEATEIKKYDLASFYWKGLAEAMATFETAVVTYKDGHTANSSYGRTATHWRGSAEKKPTSMRSR